jgi:hypothetical protein
MVQEHNISSSQESEARQFAKENIRVQRCVEAEDLTWADAFDPSVIVSSTSGASM